MTPTHDSCKSYTVVVHCRSTLSSKTTAYYLLRSTLSSGIIIQPTIYRTPLCLMARLETTCAPLRLMARLETTLQPGIYFAPIYLGGTLWITTDYLLRSTPSAGETRDYVISNRISAALFTLSHETAVDSLLCSSLSAGAILQPLSTPPHSVWQDYC
jgi:hypothetical protein